MLPGLVNNPSHVSYNNRGIKIVDATDENFVFIKYISLELAGNIGNIWVFDARQMSECRLHWLTYFNSTGIYSMSVFQIEISFLNCN